MAVSTFVRRKRATGPWEYAFFTAESIEFVGDENIISPTIPGDDASDVSGHSSASFMMSLGAQRLTIRVSGYMLDVPNAEIPTIDGTDYYLTVATTDLVNYPDGVYPTTTKPASGLTAKEVRHILVSFWSNQSKVGTGTDYVYSSFEIGWPNWIDIEITDANIYKVPASTGTIYRFFEGMMRQPRGLENAGELNQYPDSFTWQVGAVGPDG